MFKKTLTHFSFLSSVFFLGAGCCASGLNDDEADTPTTTTSTRSMNDAAVAAVASSEPKLLSVSVKGGNWGYKFPARWYPGIGDCLKSLIIIDSNFTWHPAFGSNAPVLRILTLIGCTIRFEGDSTRKLGLNTPQLGKVDFSGSITHPDSSPIVTLINKVGSEELFKLFLTGKLVIAVTKDDGTNYSGVEIAERLLEFGNSQAASPTTLGTWSKLLTVGLASPNNTTFSDDFRGELPELVKTFRERKSALEASASAE